MPERIELTPSQRRRCNRLIKRLCANYDDGNSNYDDGNTNYDDDGTTNYDDGDSGYDD